MAPGGTWIKLMDTFPEHAKVAAAGPAAAWLYVCGLAYCSRLLTDGRIPKSVALRLADIKAPQREVAKLVAVGLWHDVDDAYEVHDYAEHQRSSEQVEADREAARERKRRQRDKGKRPPPVPPESRRDMPVSHAEVRLQETEAVSETTSSSGSSTTPTQPDTTVVEEDERLRHCWDLLARTRLRHQRTTGAGPTNEIGWLRKVAADARTELYDEAVRRITQYPTITAQQLAEVLNGQTSILQYLPRASGT